MKHVQILFKSGATLTATMEDKETDRLREQFKLNGFSVYAKTFKTTDGEIDIVMAPVHAIVADETRAEQ